MRVRRHKFPIGACDLEALHRPALRHQTASRMIEPHPQPRALTHRLAQRRSGVFDLLAIRNHPRRQRQTQPDILLSR